MSDLNDMMVFQRVVVAGSFTRAAEAIGLPKSNISRKVSRLEASLGVRLLERSTRSLHLTEIGRIYHEHCVRIQEEVDSALECVEALAAVPRGWLKVCTSVTFGQCLLAPLLANFQKRYPQVLVDLRLDNRRIDIIDEGIDVAIRVGRSPDSSLVSKPLCAVALHLYASPDYLASAREDSSQGVIHGVEDLQRQRCLFMSAMGDSPRWQLFSSAAAHSASKVAGREQYVDITPAFISDDFNVLAQLAADGLGVALLPDYMCGHAVAEGRLVRVLESWVGRQVDVCAIYPSRKGVTPKVRVFLDYLAERLAG